MHHGHCTSTSSDPFKKGGIRKNDYLRNRASPRPLTSTFHFVFLKLWLFFFILWKFHKGNFCLLFFFAVLLSNFILIWFSDTKFYYVMRLALNSSYRILPLLAEFIGICHHTQIVCDFTSVRVKYACTYVCLHVCTCEWYRVMLHTCL